MERKTYTVCHDCQMTGGGITHCAHADTCGGTKDYPKELRKMIIDSHNSGVPLSIIAERAFDMAKA